MYSTGTLILKHKGDKLEHCCIKEQINYNMKEMYYYFTVLLGLSRYGPRIKGQCKCSVIFQDFRTNTVIL